VLIPNIHFPGNCDEALNFYKDALGAQVKEIHYFRDAPPNSGMEGLPPDFVMHSEVVIFDTTMYITDGGEKRPSGENFSFLISIDTAEEAAAIFEKIADTGKIIVALAPQFWSSLYGSVEDAFGVQWQIMLKE